MDEKNLSIEFRIKGILVTNFSVNLREEYIKLDQEAKGTFKDYVFEVNCKNNVYVPNDIINVETFVKIFLDIDKKIELGKLQIENVYEVKNLKDFYNEKENSLNLPPDFEASLIGISLSHARAIFITKCAGTFLQNAVLPILRPKDFLKKKLENQEKEKSNSNLK